jgi:hypothetical protein
VELEGITSKGLSEFWNLGIFYIAVSENARKKPIKKVAMKITQRHNRLRGGRQG